MQHSCKADWTHGWWEEEEEVGQGASPRGVRYLLLHCAYHIKRDGPITNNFPREEFIGSRYPQSLRQFLSLGTMEAISYF